MLAPILIIITIIIITTTTTITIVEVGSSEKEVNSLVKFYRSYQNKAN